MKSRISRRSERISSTPIVIMSHPSLPANSLADVIAMAKKDPAKISAGSPPPRRDYFAIELMKVMAGIDLTTVTYKGTGRSPTIWSAGMFTLAFNTIAPALGNIQAGKIKAIAVASPSARRRCPTCRPPRRRGCRASKLFFITRSLRRAGTPRPIIDRINKEMRTIIESDEISKRIVSDGGDPAPSTPDEYAAMICARRGEVGRT